MNTVRHPAELEWSEERRELDPTLEDLTQWAIAHQLDRPARELPRLRIVHRLDKETSGLVVFARSVLAERELGLQFRKHTVVRRYLAVVPGFLSPRTIRSNLVHDRGDGRRGSTQLPGRGQGSGHARRGRGAAAGLHAAVVPAGNRPHAPDPHSPRRKPATRSAATRCT